MWSSISPAPQENFRRRRAPWALAASSDVITCRLSACFMAQRPIMLLILSLASAASFHAASIFSSGARKVFAGSFPVAVKLHAKSCQPQMLWWSRNSHAHL